MSLPILLGRRQLSHLTGGMRQQRRLWVQEEIQMNLIPISFRFPSSSLSSGGGVIVVSAFLPTE